MSSTSVSMAPEFALWQQKWNAACDWDIVRQDALAELRVCPSSATDGVLARFRDASIALAMAQLALGSTSTARR